MVPSEDDIAKFVTFAPNASEGIAFLFLEVKHVKLFEESKLIMLMCHVGCTEHR
jgi:hypothetical protein